MFDCHRKKLLWVTALVFKWRGVLQVLFVGQRNKMPKQVLAFIIIINYNNFVGHCGVFCGLKYGLARCSEPMRNKKTT